MKPTRRELALEKQEVEFHRRQLRADAIQILDSLPTMLEKEKKALYFSICRIPGPAIKNREDVIARLMRVLDTERESRSATNNYSSGPRTNQKGWHPLRQPSPGRMSGARWGSL